MNKSAKHKVRAAPIYRNKRLGIKQQKFIQEFEFTFIIDNQTINLSLTSINGRLYYPDGEKVAVNVCEYLSKSRSNKDIIVDISNNGKKIRLDLIKE